MATIYKDLPQVSYTIQSGTNSIRLWADCGDGQKGAYLIFLGMELKAANQPADLGTGQAIRGQQALVSATITDVLQQTNWTSITVYLQEGANAPVEFGPYEEQVPAEKDSIVYTLPISFV